MQDVLKDDDFQGYGLSREEFRTRQLAFAKSMAKRRHVAFERSSSEIKMKRVKPKYRATIENGRLVMVRDGISLPYLEILK